MEPASTSRLPALPVVLAGSIGLVALSLFHPSTTRMLIWPWIALADAWWLLILTVAVVHLLRGTVIGSRLATAGLLALALVGVIAAHGAFLPGISRPAALPLLGACALPLALAPAFASRWRGGYMATLGAVAVALLAVSLGQWFIDQVLPATDAGRSWIDALGQRNDRPFGHSNYTAGFALLCVPWLLVCAIGATTPTARAGWLAASVLAAGILVSTGSRAGVAGLVLALGAGAALAHRELRQLSPRLRWLAAAVLIGVMATGLLGNARLRERLLHGQWSTVANESNDQRLGMAQGALRLGAERPLLGWGPGAIPHVFPHVRSSVAGNVDNVLQVHSTPLQVWATLGTLGAVACAVLLAGLVATLMRRSSAATARDRSLERAVLGGGAMGFGCFACFDHGLDIPALATLAGAQMAALLATESPTPRTKDPVLAVAGAAILALGTLSLLPALWSDARARQAHSQALSALEAGDPAGYVECLTRAAEALPAAAYPAHQLACFLATGHPFPNSPPPRDSAAAIAALRSTLDRNPFLEYAHYNLGWLLLQDRQFAAAETAFTAAARLAPHRGAVFHGLGLARAAQGRTDDAVRAFAADRLNDPRQAFAATFSDDSAQTVGRAVAQAARHALSSSAEAGEISRETAARVAAAWTAVPAHPEPAGPAYRRQRLGYGVLLGFPEGPPLVDFNVQQAPAVPAEIAARLPPPAWIPGEVLLRLALGAPAAGPIVQP